MSKNKHQLERDIDETKASDALAKADSAELHVLFQKALKRYDEMEDALTKIVAHYVGDKEAPRYSNGDGLKEMARISSEALALARFVVENAGAGKK